MAWAYADYLKSDGWKEISGKRREIDGNTCVCCGSRENLNVHHAWYPDSWNDTSVECLRTVCHDCHVILHRAQEIYDKWGRMWKPTKDGYLVQEGPYNTFRGELSQLAALECWRKNRFVAKEIYSWVHALNEIIELDNVRYIYRISGEDITRLLAFCKDCFIENNSPTFNMQKRRARKKEKTRIK